MHTIYRAATLTFAVLLPVFSSYGQAPGQPQAATPDVLTSTDGEKFVGHLISSNDTAVVFQSDAAGQVSVPWSKIQELHSSSKFAVIPKGVKLEGAQDEGKVPQGSVAVADQQLQVTAGAQASPQAVPVTNVAQVMTAAAFERAFQRRSFFSGWIGGATVGLAYTSSTQTSQSYTAAVNLTRAVPGETWLDQKRRTIVSLNEAYGEISQPATPTTKTSVFHLGVEQDWYLKPRLFTFVHALLDHNYSQGLDLQQEYGGGLGYVLIKSPKQELDVRASMDYINQRFAIASHNRDLIGSTFGEAYLYKFPGGILFTETGNYIPAWNDTSAYSAVVNANLTFPVYHHLGLTIGGIDNYLNNPPVGFKKNSFTITFGATYSLQ